MADDSMEKATCVSRYGKYKLEMIPFGSTEAPAKFQRMMKEVLRGLMFAILYFENFLMF